MRSTLLFRAAALAGGMVLAAACGGGNNHTGSGGGGGGHIVPTGFSCSGAKPHYMADVAPIFAAHCAGVEGCHVPMHDPDAAYSFLVSQPADECPDGRDFVSPGDPEHSYAIQKMTDTNLCSGNPMPNSLSKKWTTKLPDPIVQTVYDWVCAGAKKD